MQSDGSEAGLVRNPNRHEAPPKVSPREIMRVMLQVLVSTASQLLADLNRSLLREKKPTAAPRPMIAGPVARYQPLQRVLLTDGVGRTLFEEYATHRAQARGDEETGWMLMGLREKDEALVL